jgi:hypothetical protein
MRGIEGKKDSLAPPGERVRGEYGSIFESRYA